MTFRRVGGWWRHLSFGAKVALVLLVAVAVGSALAIPAWGSLDQAQLRIADRIESGKPVPYHYYLPVWGIYGSALNVVLSSVLAVLVGWWGSRDKAPPLETSKPEPLSNLALGSALVALVVAAILNAPRLHHSLWGDEEQTLKESVVGQYKADASGELEFHEVTWRDVFFGYKSTNNHILFSAVAKLSHDVLHQPDDTGTYFSEWAVRLPAFLAGLLALPAIAWATHRLGFIGAAAWAPWVLLGHAWYTRYSTDARGYGFVLLLAPLAVGVATRCVQSGQWRHWCCLALLSFALLYTFPGSIYLLVLLHAAVAVVLIRRPDPQERLAQMGRWILPSAVVALAFIQLFAPCFPQMCLYIHRIFAVEHGYVASWFTDELAYLATGEAWHRWEQDNPFAGALSERVAARPVPTVIGLVAILLSFLTGCLALIRTRKARPWAIALLLAGPMAVLHGVAAGHYLYPWYLVPCLTGIAISLAIGMHCLVENFASTIASGLTVPPKSWISVAAGVALLTALWQPAGLRNQLLRTYPIEPLKESSEIYRRYANPEHPDFGKEALSAHIHMYTEAYDPAGVRVKNEFGLLDLMSQSDATGLPLFVDTAIPDLGAEVMPDVFGLLRDREKFEQIGPLWGLYKASSRWVFRYRGSETQVNAFQFDD